MSVSAQSNFNVRFGNPAYVTSLGQPLPVQVLIDPVPSAGLFSYGIRFNLSASASNALITSLSIPAGLDFSGSSNAAIRVFGNRFAAVKGTINVFAEPLRTYTNSLLATLTLTNLPLGTHTIGLALYNTLGPTEEIFLDGAGTVLDSNITFGNTSVSVQSSEAPLQAALEIVNAVPVLNHQSGLFEQVVRIKSAVSASNIAYCVIIQGLPGSASVYNAWGITNNAPFVIYNRPIPPGQSVDLTLEYFFPDRIPTTPQLELFIVNPFVVPNPQGAILAVDQSLRLSNNTYMVEFSTLSNRHYFIQYSGDGNTWKTAMPSVPGTGRRALWIDNGPPKTDPSPVTEPNRSYRVRLEP